MQDRKKGARKLALPVRNDIRMSLVSDVEQGSNLAEIRVLPCISDGFVAEPSCCNYSAKLVF